MSERRSGGRAPTSPARVRRAERQATALAMRLDGASSPDIARALGVSRTTAWRLIDDALRARREEIAERTEALRAIEHERIEQYIGQLRPLALAGDLGAHRALLRWHERLARLLDLDLQRELVQVVPEIHVNFAVPPLPAEAPETVDAEPVELAALEAGEVDEGDGEGGPSHGV